MKSTTIACAAIAATLGLGSLAQAQDFRRGNRWDGPRYEQPERPDWREQRDRVDYTPYMPNNGQAPHNQAWQDNRQGRHYGNQGNYAQGPRFHRGGYVPPQYRARQYAVNDWHARHLSAPPHGYQWVDTGADYALIAIATGLIAQLVLNAQ